MLKAQEQRDPHIWEALLSLVSLVAGISISIVVYGADPVYSHVFGCLCRCGDSMESRI